MGRKELLALISAIMAFTGMGIDVILAAFPEIRADFSLGVASSETSRVVTVFMLGLAAGQLFYGPLADRFGRKRTFVAGAVVYVLGAVISALASTFGVMLIGRFVWGVGGAGARVVATSIVRDRFEGAAMASTRKIGVTSTRQRSLLGIGGLLAHRSRLATRWRPSLSKAGSPFT